jgi:hypothetical protein
MPPTSRVTRLLGRDVVEDEGFAGDERRDRHGPVGTGERERRGVRHVGAGVGRGDRRSEGECGADERD